MGTLLSSKRSRHFWVYGFVERFFVQLCPTIRRGYTYVNIQRFLFWSSDRDGRRPLETNAFPRGLKLFYRGWVAKLFCWGCFFKLFRRG